MKVRLGEWNAKEDDEPYKNVEIPIESVLIHPGFNPENLQNDLALVRLAAPVDTKSYPHIESICLPQKGYPYTGKRYKIYKAKNIFFSLTCHSISPHIWECT